MEEVIVRKQGRVNYSHWSSRVLTLDPMTGVLLLSKKGYPQHVSYHAMQPTRIEVWPHYDCKYVEEEFDSLPAKLTIRLAGNAYPGGTDGDGRHPSRVVNSAGMSYDEAWVLRFTSLAALRDALEVLERLTRLQSRETDDDSFGDTVKTERCARLPASAQELFHPIRAAWIENQRKKQAKQDVIEAWM